MTRIAIMPYGPSDSVTALVAALRARDVEVVRLRRVGSNFRGRAGDLIVNWGNSNIDLSGITGAGSLLNPPAAIRRASHKTTAFEAMRSAGNVPLVESTTRRQEAQAWLAAGHTVYARTVLQGHSGEGIVVCAQTAPADLGQIQFSDTLVQAPLYTKAITDQRREFRIHVMNGVITFVQQKRRADGWQQNPQYSNIVRNHSTGWIYAQQSVEPNQAAKDAAIRAVQALGLNFGAVDVITRRDEAWVLEVNTAPGLTGTNLETYVENLIRIHNGTPPVQWVSTATNEDRLADAAEVAGPAPTAEPAPAPRRGGRRAAAAPAGPVAGAFYKATYNGTRTVAQYNAGADAYYVVGWDMPITLSDGFEVDLSAPIEV